MYDNSKAVAVYDPVQKKAVLLFKSQLGCANYLAVEGASSRKVQYHVMVKKQIYSNRFEKNLAVRNANEEQKAQLGTKEYIVLDETYRVAGILDWSY